MLKHDATGRVPALRRPALPPLGALRAFEAAARHLSFRAAAEELGVTQSAVSHQIASLETAMGTKLFERQTRQVSLTDAGELLRPFCSDAFDRIARGAQLLRQLKGKGTLVIETYATVLVRWLLPRLPAFQALSPDLSIRFGASQPDWEIDVTDADVGILWTMRPSRPGYDYVLLAQARLVPVCSPALMRDLGPAPDAVTIGHMPRLALHTAEGDWDAWFASTGAARTPGQGRIEFDTYLSAIEAAARGQGVALAPEFLVADDLAAGRLRIPVPLSATQPGGWYLLHRSDRRDDVRITAFSRWVSAEMGSRRTARDARSLAVPEP